MASKMPRCCNRSAIVAGSTLVLPAGRAQMVDAIPCGETLSHWNVFSFRWANWSGVRAADGRGAPGGGGGPGALGAFGGGGGGKGAPGIAGGGGGGGGGGVLDCDVDGSEIGVRDGAGD